MAQLRSAAAGDRAVWDLLIIGHRERLRQLIAFRMGGRWQRRFDPSDVIQETCVEAVRRLPEYVERPTLPFFLWLRLLAQQQLAFWYRHHSRQKRDATRDVPIEEGHDWSSQSSAQIVHQLANRKTPSGSVLRREREHHIAAALERMEPLDREVLALRHFEGLTNGEVAQTLGLNTSAASKRYI